MSLASQVSNKLNSPSPNNKSKANKTPKEKRRSSKLERESVITQAIVASGTQWYTVDPIDGGQNGNAMPVFELRQEVL